MVRIGFEEIYCADSKISWELGHLESLDDILAIGEPQLVKSALAKLDDNSSFNEESPGSLADEGKQMYWSQWELGHLESLDDILAIGEPQLVKSTLAKLDDNSSFNKPSATSVLEESPGSLADQGKQNILHVFDELIHAYRDEAFQAQLQLLFEAENKLRKRQAKAPAVRRKGSAHVKGRDDLCKNVLCVVLPMHDFLGVADGRLAFSLAMRPYCHNFDVREKMRMIDSLLGLPLGSTLADFRYLVKLHQPHLKIDTMFSF